MKKQLKLENSVEERNHATSPHVHAAATRVGYAQPQSPFQSFLPTSSISISSSSHRPHTPPPSQPSVEPQAQLPSHFFVQLADFIMPQIAQLIETSNSRVTGEVRETLLGIQANMDDSARQPARHNEQQRKRRQQCCNSPQRQPSTSSSSCGPSLLRWTIQQGQQNGESYLSYQRKTALPSPLNHSQLESSSVAASAAAHPSESSVAWK